MEHRVFADQRFGRNFGLTVQRRRTVGNWRTQAGAKADGFGGDGIAPDAPCRLRVAVLLQADRLAATALPSSSVAFRHLMGILLAGMLLIPCGPLRLGYAQENKPRERASVGSLLILDLSDLAAQKQVEIAEEAKREQRRAAIERLDSLLSQGLLDEALAAYRKQPLPECLRRLDDELQRAGRGLEMLAIYEHFLLAVPEDPEEPFAWPGAPDRLGVARDVIGRIVGVERGPDTAKLLSRRLAERPQDAWLHLRLGYLWCELRDREKAIAEFDRYAAAQEKLSPRWLGWLAQLCSDVRLTDRAIAYYQQALKLPITDEEVRNAARWSAIYQPRAQIPLNIKADLLSNLGELYRRQQRWPEAEQCYLDVLKLDREFKKKSVPSPTPANSGRCARSNRRTGVASGSFRIATRSTNPFITHC